MEETLISFETVKLAKEKGFHINFPKYVYRESGILREVLDCTGGSYQKDEYAAPTQSLLQKWLRDNHNIDISIHRSFSMNKSYHYTILINCDYDNIIQQICEPNRNYETSLELALQEALKNIKN